MWCNQSITKEERGLYGLHTGIVFLESIDECITEDCVIRIIDKYINQLDVKALGFKFAERPSVGRSSLPQRHVENLCLRIFEPCPFVSKIRAKSYSKYRSYVAIKKS